MKSSVHDSCELPYIEVDEQGEVKLRKGVAKNRRITIEDEEMRHGRKNRTKKIDGYKRHILKELDLGMVRAVGITMANEAEASVTEAIANDLKQQKVQLSELHIDRAYLSSSLVKNRDPELTIYCKARYIGVRKNLFDLRRTAVVHNLHVLIRLLKEEPELFASKSGTA